MRMRQLLMCLIALACWSHAAGVSAAAPERPLVFVPGILGSRLCDAAGQALWGERSSLSNLSRLEITGTSTDLKLHPCGIVEQIQLVGRFWSIDQYNLLLASLKDAGYETDKNLFVFGYDWRLSNFETAKLLDAFIQKHVGNTPFDILAHSMGGIVSRIYMDRYPSASSLKRILYMGTPFLGAMNTFGTIKEGWGALKNTLAGGQDVIWRVALSFPAMLELLPRYDDCCYVRAATNARIPLDVFDVDTWTRLGWLPPAYSNPARLALFTSILREAKTLTPLLSKTAPSGVYEILFASDAHSTLRKVGMKEGTTQPGDWVFSREVGDGTVPVWSAARRPDQTGYDNSLPSFAEHATIFDDKWLVAEVTRVLFKRNPQDPDPVAGRGKPTLSIKLDGQPAYWAVKFSDLTLSGYIVPTSSSVTADLSIKLDDAVTNPRTGIYLPKASFRRQGTTTMLSVVETTSADDLENKTLTFRAVVQNVESGTGQIVFELAEDYSSQGALYAVDN